MKLISLNTWGGRGGHQKLLDFFKTHADTDVFCLQEVWADGSEDALGRIGGGTELVGVATKLLQDIQTILSTHTMFFRPHVKDYYGLALFIKNDWNITEEGELFVYKDRGFVDNKDTGNHARNIQYITIDTSQGQRTVINFHGLWNGQGKTDTPDRLLQSDNIITFAKQLNHPFVLCGDFNLLPDTKSIQKFNLFGLRNLITEYGITSTRTSLYTKEHQFADYVLTSKDIMIHDFKVLPDEVSDHAPLFLNFD